jgi:hypothetical protein
MKEKHKKLQHRVRQKKQGISGKKDNYLTSAERSMQKQTASHGRSIYFRSTVMVRNLHLYMSKSFLFGHWDTYALNMYQC